MICAHCHAENDDSADQCRECGRELFALAAGQVLNGRYEIKGRLGRGGMGVVYRAHDRELDEDVALKTLRPDVAASPVVGKRFRSEIKLARTISHPNVCRIHDYGKDGALGYIVMELVDGVDLKQVVQERGPLPAETAYAIAIQAAEALQAIHEGGIVHRDLKTQNIMQDARGAVKVMDFGIAKRVEGGSRKGTTGVTDSGQILGTPEYMSPEQVQAETLDARSDLYALGIVVFELFTGEVPFRADSFMATAFKQVHEAVPLEGPRASRIPPALAPVLQRALAKNRTGRFGSAKEMAEALGQARERTRQMARAETNAAGGARRRMAERRPTVAANRPRGVVPSRAASALALVVVLGGLAYSLLRKGAPPTADSAVPRVSETVVPMPSVMVPRESFAAVVEPRTAAPRSAPASPTLRPRSAIAATPSAPTPAVAPVTAFPPVAAANTEAPSPAEPPALVQLAVKPWAAVTVDGTAIGTTPISPLSLAPGLHTFQFTHPDYRPFLRRVTLEPGEERVLKVDFGVVGVPK